MIIIQLVVYMNVWLKSKFISSLTVHQQQQQLSQMDLHKMGID